MSIRDVPATLAVLAGTAATWASVAIRPTEPLFGLVVPAALLPVAYVVDTGTRPHTDALRRREAGMLLGALLTVVLSGTAFAVQSLAADAVAGAAALATLVLVASNWRRRRARR